MNSIMKKLFLWIRRISGGLPPEERTLQLKDIQVGDTIKCTPTYESHIPLDPYYWIGKVTKINLKDCRIFISVKSFYDRGRESFFTHEFIDDFNARYYEFELVGREYDPKQQPYTKEDI